MRESGEQGRRGRREREEEGGAEVCAEAGEEAEGRGEGDGLFDVEVETLKVVFPYNCREGEVICVELLGSCELWFWL